MDYEYDGPDRVGRHHICTAIEYGCCWCGCHDDEDCGCDCCLNNA
jgi:hypothetical protein